MPGFLRLSFTLTPHNVMSRFPTWLILPLLDDLIAFVSVVHGYSVSERQELSIPYNNYVSIVPCIGGRVLPLVLLPSLLILAFRR